MVNDGGPAYPVPSPCYDHVTKGELIGMSIRDVLAASALQGLIMNGWEFLPNDEPVDTAMCAVNRLCKSAYCLADAMLAAREANNNGQA